MFKDLRVAVDSNLQNKKFKKVKSDNIKAVS